MANNPQGALEDLTAAQLRAEAQKYRVAATRNAAHPDTAASYTRLAERLEQLAKQRDAGAGKTAAGKQAPPDSSDDAKQR